MMKLIIKLILTIFGALIIFTDLKENNTWLFSFSISIALYMIVEGFVFKKKNPQ